MAHVSQRTVFNGSALVRLLSRLADTDLREPRQATADRLSQWFGWTDAISLSAALDGVPAAASSRLRPGANAEERECAGARTALAKAIAEDAAVAAAAEFAPFRRRYFALQQAMEAGIGPLRGRLRAALAARSPAMARLAAVDVVMEQVLASREHSLLAGVPALLEKHFTRLSGDGLLTAAEPASEAQPGEWLHVFRKDMKNVLLAELDFRFQPVEGLLEAFREATRVP
ncbi:DUF3348 domain-containing protein [Variovorax paradoxus]|jgi:hypothetical protein|uniref:DUF3348 domain-containing protein n=1 Tax=Variovorax paradoxus TaxID=34073 RepID=UPI0024816510|nr:DUF3348 domain-containing protein [Variovorax paradoxus]WGT63503.1 DUF3348 domain-containing protein [Variovorax paradoxus]